MNKALLNCPLVSIVMPVYNTEKYIETSIKSVFSQTYKNWELLVIDDNSSDKSMNKVRELTESNKNYDVKIFENHVNKGAAFSRNVGITNSSGNYIAFLDSDDIWTCDKLEKQVDFMLRKKHMFTYSFYAYMDKENNEIDRVKIAPLRITYKSLLKYNNIGCLTVIVDSRIAKENLIDEKILKRNDYAMWLKYLKKTDAYCLPMVTGWYRFDSGTISNVSKFSLIKYHYYLFNKSENYSKIHASYCALRNVIYFLIYSKKYILE